MRGKLFASVLAVSLLLVGASATSLGSFTDVTATAVAVDEADAAFPCVFDHGAAGITFFKDVAGSPVAVPLAGIALVSDITEIELDSGSLSGDCDDLRPIVVILGIPLPGPDREVLSVTMLDAIFDASTVTLPVGVGDPINAVTVVPDQVRVGFCPTGQTACEP